MTDVENLAGKAGDFTATLKTRPRYVDMDKCIACGVCAEKCPRTVDDEYNEGLGKRKAAYVQYPQAVPLKYVIDAAHCIYFEKGKCRACEIKCPAGAVDFTQTEKIHDIRVGSVILAAGSEVSDPAGLEPYGYGKLPNVVTSMAFERILSSSGPFEGRLVCPLDGKPAKKIAWLQCVGSRDTHQGAQSYCSGVCCMYSIKEAVIAKEHAGNDLDAAIFYMDIRTGGKDFERYYMRARDEMGVRFIRSRIHSIEAAKEGSGDLKLTYVTEKGRLKTEIFDMVVLSVGLKTVKTLPKLATTLGINLDADGFAETAKDTSIETSRRGVFVCGAVGGPKDIPQSVVDASAASAASAALLADSRNTCIRQKEYPHEKDISLEKPRIGVFVCHCGINISGVVDVPAVRDYAATLPGVVYAVDNLFTCSQDTQHLIRDAIQEQKLNRVVVAACTPRTHEPLFQETLSEAGLNRYLFEFANIRDQVAWVHKNDPAAATQKARDLVWMAVSRVALLEPIRQLKLEVNPSALVVGAGVAGITAALNLADQGFHTYLVEQNQVLGGQTRNLAKTWKMADTRKYLARLSEKVLNHARVEVLTGAKITDITGFVGNFTTTLDLKGENRELTHGVVVLATGGHPLETDEYLCGQSERVTRWHGLMDLFDKEPERLKRADSVAFIQCVGSREPERPYCSKICCTTSVLQAIQLKKQKPSLNVYILYRDIRTYGRREHLYREARALGVVFIRYTLDQKPVVTREYEGDEEKLSIVVNDPILNIPVKIIADYLNLVTAIVPGNHRKLSKMLKVPLNDDGFFMEAHMKLRPVDFSTDGVFVCGLAHYPKPLEESMAQAQAAAMRAAGVLARKNIHVEPIVSVVDQERCIGCGLCEESCPFGAIRLNSLEGKGYRAENIPALCKGCGLCAASCPQKAIDMMHYRDRQIYAAMDAGGKSALKLKAQDPAMSTRNGFSAVSGYRLADDRYYHKGHSWIRVERGGRVKVGIDDFMAKTFGQANAFLLPEKGVSLGQGKMGFLFKRNGHSATVLSPLTGRVFDVNPKAMKSPEVIHQDPYGEGWLFILEPLILQMDLDKLYAKTESIQWLEGENRKLLGLLGPEYEKLAATGAAPLSDLFGHFPEIGWDRLVETFLHN